MTAPTVRTLCIALLLVATPSLARAGDRPIADFFGHYVGNAMAKTEDSRYLGFEIRDLDVIIEGAENGGFVLSWTTIRRQNGKEAKRTEQTMFFRPGFVPTVFGPEKQGDPAKGEDVSWARIEGDTLYTYLMAVSDKGDYELQIYTRRLTGNGMELEFGRYRDGERVRKVTGKLRRVED